MIPVVGVRFRHGNKIYDFDPKDIDAAELERGTHVIVETNRGLEYGTVVLPVTEKADDEVKMPLRPVKRVATEEDDRTEEENRVKEREAYQICRERIEKHNLDMHLVQAEYTFDNKKLLFYFTADGRVDFRSLVKDLAGEFHTRIELRQIGVRDETRLLGDVGICGRPLCCCTYLTNFAPVSIKMAKEQNLSLNPSKISGTCGRLMCCLKNEQDTYEYLNGQVPRVGTWVTTADGQRGEVSQVNVLRQTARVLVEVGDEREARDYPVDQLTFQITGGNKRGRKSKSHGGKGAQGKAAAPDKTEKTGKSEKSEKTEQTQQTQPAASADQPENG